MDAPDSRELAGEPVQLFAERALYWPRGGSLLIADLHLGKGDIFRRAGIALPSGGTSFDLGRITALLERTGASRLVVLGDFLHGAAHDSQWRTEWSGWREAHAELAVTVVLGNHDRALAGAGLGLQLVTEGHELGPFRLAHVPGNDPQQHELCGHLHPVVRVPGLPRRWPAFWLRPRQTVLPSFSSFSGGYLIESKDQDQRLACVEGHLLAMDVPVRRAGD